MGGADVVVGGAKLGVQLGVGDGGGALGGDGVDEVHRVGAEDLGGGGGVEIDDAETAVAMDERGADGRADGEVVDAAGVGEALVGEGVFGENGHAFGEGVLGDVAADDDILAGGGAGAEADDLGEKLALVVAKEDEAALGRDDLEDVVENAAEKVCQLEGRAESFGDLGEDEEATAKEVGIGGFGQRRRGLDLHEDVGVGRGRVLVGEEHEIGGVLLGRGDGIGDDLEPGPADAEAVAGAKGLGAMNAALAQEGAVGGAEVLDVPGAFALEDAGVGAGDPLVETDIDIGRGAAAEDYLRPIETELATLQTAVKNDQLHGRGLKEKARVGRTCYTYGRTRVTAGL